MNPTFTLAEIKRHGPCGIKPDSTDGFRRLLLSLGEDIGRWNPDIVVSLGDVALGSAEDALWCLRCLDWPDVAVRRAVIGCVILPALRRASVHTKDAHVHRCIDVLQHWSYGGDTLDFREVMEAAMEAAERAEAGAAVYAVTWAARAAVAQAVEAVAWAAAWAVEAVAWVEAGERERQRQDIIAAFPPVAVAFVD